MKSLEDLRHIREETLKKINLRGEGGGPAVRVVVGMATCGIAAGARPVMEACLEEAKDLPGVTVTQTGCVGVCRLEPIVEIYTPGGERVTYVKMTEEKARRVMREHAANGRAVAEYTIGAAE